MGGLVRFQVSRCDFQKAETGSALDEPIRHRIRCASDIIEEGGNALPAADTGRLRHLLAQATLDRARLRRVAKAGSRSGRVGRDFAPVRHLFIA